MICAFAAAVARGAGLVGSYLVRTLARGGKAFDTPLSVIKVACFGLLPAAALGSLATAVGAALNDADLWSYAAVWPLWWLTDAAVSLLVAPLIIAWGTEPPSRYVAGEAAVAAALAFAIGFIAFSPAADAYLAASDLMLKHRWLIAFVALMPLIGAALREDQRVSTPAICALVIAAAWGSKTVAVLNEPINERLLLLFALSVSVAYSPLILTAGFALRRGMYRRLVAARARVIAELGDTQKENDIESKQLQAFVVFFVF